MDHNIDISIIQKYSYSLGKAARDKKLVIDDVISVLNSKDRMRSIFGRDYGDCTILQTFKHRPLNMYATLCYPKYNELVRIISYISIERNEPVVAELQKFKNMVDDTISTITKDLAYDFERWHDEDDDKDKKYYRDENHGLREAIVINTLYKKYIEHEGDNIYISKIVADNFGAITNMKSPSDCKNQMARIIFKEIEHDVRKAMALLNCGIIDDISDYVQTIQVALDDVEWLDNYVQYVIKQKDDIIKIHQ